MNRVGVMAECVVGQEHAELEIQLQVVDFPVAKDQIQPLPRSRLFPVARARILAPGRRPETPTSCRYR
jgi:hypothetical protein